jgi:pimeloyl-ACP methyl ester carboxylesterase
MRKKIVTFPAAVLSLSAALQCVAAPPAEQGAFARPQHLIDIGGRQLNLHCDGAGSPVVLFEGGQGEAGWDWLLVQPIIASRTTACFYDRAGLGFSDATTRAATSGNAAEDLHALLAKASLRPPYILVGHSYGGMIVEQYTYRYRQEVSGLVLVEAQHEDEAPRLDALTGGGYSKIMASILDSDRQCLAGAEQGFAPGTAITQQCVSPQPRFDGALQAAHLAEAGSVKYWRTSVAEFSDLFTLSADQLRAARGPFGDLPLVSLTRGVSPFLIPGQPQSATNKAIEAENKAMQDEVAALSSRGSNSVVSGASHSIHLEKPDAVIAAVNRVLDMQ